MFCVLLSVNVLQAWFVARFVQRLVGSPAQAPLEL